MFYNLPNDVLSNIYMFDDTYRQKYKNDVMLEMWRSVWHRWNNKNSAKKQIVMRYLFETWNIYSVKNRTIPANDWFNFKCVPDDIHFAFTPHMYKNAVYVAVYYKHTRIFLGLIYESISDYYVEKCMNENDDLIEFFIDYDKKNDLVLIQFL